MLDIGWTEILIIMVIALVVVGPKDLPRIVRTIGQWSGKARAYARDFQRSIEEAADETEIAAIQKEIATANEELSTARADLGSSIKLDDDPSPPEKSDKSADKPADETAGSGPAAAKADGEPAVEPPKSGASA